MPATTIVWQGLDAPRMEVARVEVGAGRALRATGTQLGVAYELRYELTPELLRLELVAQLVGDPDLRPGRAELGARPLHAGDLEPVRVEPAPHDRFHR